ncbi:MAG: DUF859 family phage minor structural protein [Burkholderiales bacterium]|nr:DUF859 family phage minor structural protein [Burkholderiales bacterium]
MASTSGLFNTSGYSGGGYPDHYEFSWNLQSQSIADNTSIISWKLVAGGGSTSGRWTSVKEKYVTVNGSTQSNSTVQQTYNGTTPFSGTATIYHDNEGKGSFSASAGGAFYYYGSYNSNGSGSWELPQIARASKLNDISNFNLGSNINISFTKYSTNFVDELYITLGGVNVCYRANIPTNYTLALTQNELNEIYLRIPNANTALLTFTIFTYSGLNQIGSSVKTATASVINSNPTFNNYDYLDSNGNVVSITENNQVIVKNKSTLRIVISEQNKMVTNNYSTPKNYLATCDDKNITINYSDISITADLGIITNAGIKRLSIKATDSRGNSTTIYKDINIVEYETPTSNTEITRLNNFENQTTITMNGSFNLLTLNGINKNTIQSVRYRYSEQGTQYPTTWNDMIFQIINNSFQVTNVVLSLDNTKAFAFQFEIVDKLEAVYITRTVDIGKELMFLNADTGDLEVMGDIYAKGKKIGGLETAQNNSENANNINETSIYMMTGGISANMPTSNWMYLFTLKDIRENRNTTQLAFDDVSNRMYIRNRNGSGTWSSWKQLAMISYGTSNPGTLMDGEIYIKY